MPSLGFPLAEALDDVYLPAPDPAEKAVYGTDLFFDGRKHVTSKGDWQTVLAVENLRRAILRRIITRPGTDRLKPNYGAGLLDYVKKPRSQAILEELQGRVRSQVNQDRRVDKVLDVVVTPAVFGSVPGIRVVVTVQAFGRIQRPMTFNFKKVA